MKWRGEGTGIMKKICDTYQDACVHRAICTNKGISARKCYLAPELISRAVCMLHARMTTPVKSVENLFKQRYCNEYSMLWSKSGISLGTSPTNAIKIVREEVR